ncbi:MAG: hypothetical protein DRH44_04515 [Candidatus Coatesbacteria bacterium]|nr:MAG: hypothetical protein DRH49_02715 [Candidatus Coatesbacteria bacterium]RLC43661.1 MAG: hypothetical protein DRH44_04515 [Candidatus Coatesbacteria bacterium]
MMQPKIWKSSTNPLNDNHDITLSIKSKGDINPRKMTDTEILSFISLLSHYLSEHSPSLSSADNSLLSLYLDLSIEIIHRITFSLKGKYLYLYNPYKSIKRKRR